MLANRMRMIVGASQVPIVLRDYIAIVGSDSAFDSFYFSPLQQQFLVGPDTPEPVVGGHPTSGDTNFSFKREGNGPGCENFFAQTPMNQPEICDQDGTGSAPPFTFRGKYNVRTSAGNAGFFEWWIRLPLKPVGPIGIEIQFGVLYPNVFVAYGFQSIGICAGETGERCALGICSRQEVDPGGSPIDIRGLPNVEAVAYPGPNSFFSQFHLTAFKESSDHDGVFNPAMTNSGNCQILNGSTSARFVIPVGALQCITTKLPVTGQVNASSETENELVAGDIIRIRINVPRGNTVDIYAHAQSVRLTGVGQVL